MNSLETTPSRRGAAVGRGIARVLLRIFWRIRVHGAEHVPATGPVIMAPNHTGFVDAPLLMATSPRPIHALAKKELFRGPLGWFLHRIGQIPLDRDEPGRAMVQAGMSVLDDDQILVVFPEGTRGAGDFKEVRTGLAWFALRSGAPVIPVVFRGTGNRGRTLVALPRVGSRLHVVYGEPITVTTGNDQGGGRGRAALDAATTQLQDSLRAHAEAAAEESE